MTGTLILENNKEFQGISFGAITNNSGEVVFSTGMVGYPESLTDPSYKGQILILTYPIIGSYGIPDKIFWESHKIQISGLIVSQYIDTPSHHSSKKTLSSWLKEENIPALEISDTRFLTQIIREKGTLLGKIEITNSNHKNFNFYDPNKENLIKIVSTKKIIKHIASKNNKLNFLLIDCGVKRNIINSLLKRGVNVTQVPWDYNPFLFSEKFDGIIVTNGPGDPKSAMNTIQTLKIAINKKLPILGVCMGNQLLALAAGGDTYKLPYGHRSQNQPCIEVGTKRCYITTQNHGFAISKIPKNFDTWFINANDQSIEGIKHRNLPFMSVQFHPEANPGPTDTEWVFDYFLEAVKKYKNE